MVYAPVRPEAALPPVLVNLYSDTQTKPSAAMKEAMLRAEVGDEQHGDDPTIHALCDRMAALLGKQAAVFLPSGTMCNQIAILTHCRPGDEIIAHEASHIIANEGGGPGALAGASVLGLRGARGQFDVPTLQAAFREKRRNSPPQTLLEVEQTANAGGGSVWPLDKLNAVLDAAHDFGLATHMDGARLMNAVVVAGIPAHEMAAGCDSVWLDFTKGLARRWARCCAAAKPSSTRPGAGNNGSAGRCARPGSARRRACTRWTTISTAWPRTTPTPASWRVAWRKSPAWWSRSRKPTWSFSTRPAPARPRTNWPTGPALPG